MFLRVPAVAVACGADLLVYKNAKPYFKFGLPALPIAALEKEVWRKFQEESNPDFARGFEDLKSLPYNTLSSR